MREQHKHTHTHTHLVMMTRVIDDYKHTHLKLRSVVSWSGLGTGSCTGMGTETRACKRLRLQGHFNINSTARTIILKTLMTILNPIHPILVQDVL